MYTYKYIAKVNGANRTKGVYIKSIRERTILQAQFDFRDETPSRTRKTVASRINLKYPYDLLVAYFTQNKGLTREDEDLVSESDLDYDDRVGINDLYDSREANFYFDRANKRVVVRRSRFSKLKFSVTATADANIPLEQMLDLEGINKLILTGEFPEKNY